MQNTELELEIPLTLSDIEAEKHRIQGRIAQIDQKAKGYFIFIGIGLVAVLSGGSLYKSSLSPLEMAMMLLLTLVAAIIGAAGLMTYVMFELADERRLLEEKLTALEELDPEKMPKECLEYAELCSQFPELMTYHRKLTRHPLIMEFNQAQNFKLDKDELEVEREFMDKSELVEKARAACTELSRPDSTPGEKA